MNGDKRRTLHRRGRTVRKTHHILVGLGLDEVSVHPYDQDERHKNNMGSPIPIHNVSFDMRDL